VWRKKKDFTGGPGRNRCTGCRKVLKFQKKRSSHHEKFTSRTTLSGEEDQETNRKQKGRHEGLRGTEMGNPRRPSPRANNLGKPPHAPAEGQREKAADNRLILWKSLPGIPPGPLSKSKTEKVLMRIGHTAESKGGTRFESTKSFKG